MRVAFTDILRRKLHIGNTRHKGRKKNAKPPRDYYGEFLSQLKVKIKCSCCFALLLSLFKVDQGLFFPFFSSNFQCPFLHLHNSKTCYNPILVGEYLALLSQQYGIWVILLNMNGPFTGLNGVAWQWPSFPSLLHAQNNIQSGSLGIFPRNQQKGNLKLSLKPSKH